MFDMHSNAPISGAAFVAAMAQATSEVDSAIEALRVALSADAHEYAIARRLADLALDKMATCVLLAAKGTDRLWATYLYRRKHAVVSVLQAGAQVKDRGSQREGRSGTWQGHKTHVGPTMSRNIVRLSGCRFGRELA